MPLSFDVGEQEKEDEMENIMHWTCPYCDRDSTLREGDFQISSTKLTRDNAEGPRCLESVFIICPNPHCNKIALSVSLYEIEWNGHCHVEKGKLKTWRLLPPSMAQAFPSYVPQPVVDDYDEACLICDLSPKASATLSRRCLQGILRDFWHVKPGRLVDEIEQIKDKTDPLTWEAIDSVRKIGNIGAHMEKDINLIVDVDQNEAELLMGLIETLIRDWYIAREERRRRLEQIKGIATSKDQSKKNPQQSA